LSEAASVERQRQGIGNWDAFKVPLEKVYEAGREWAAEAADIEKPWLCWNVEPAWCLMQQKLVREVGWTPLVGFDPRIGPPPLLPEAKLIDFNRVFQLPLLYLHVPVEFAFLFTRRLAFWHADLLCRLGTMHKLARIFEKLPDGEMAAVLDRGGLKDTFKFYRHRYWELIGCTTQGASRHQFEVGSGWWMHVEKHPSCRDPEELERRKKLYWDHGIGIRYWEKRYGGRIHSIPLRLVAEGHCAPYGNPKYKHTKYKDFRRKLSEDLNANFSLEAVARKLGLEKLLEA
jgi:hypothetical protein